MLEQDGAFSHLCKHTTIVHGNHTITTTATHTIDSTNPLVCSQQSRALQYISFIAVILARIATPIFGAISDRYGPLILQLILSIMGCVGISRILLASFVNVHGLLYLAFILIGFMAMAAQPMIMEVSYLYSLPSSRRRVISSLECLWDIGCGLGYWILWAINKSSKGSFLLVMGMYLIIACLVCTSSVYLWHVVLSVRENLHENSLDCTSSVSSCSSISSSLIVSKENLDDHVEHGLSGVLRLPSNGCESISEHPYADGTRLNTTITAPTPPASFIKHALSVRFIILTLVFAVHDSRIIFTHTSSREFLRHLGDDQTGNRYLTISSLISPVAILGLPLIELFVERWGYIVSLQLINVTAIIHGIILVTSSNLNVQILGFILLAVYRCFTYSIILSYLAVISDKQVIGKLTGVIYLVPGLFQLINLPITDWTINLLDGNYFWPNLIYAIIVIPCIIGVWFLGHQNSPRPISENADVPIEI